MRRITESRVCFFFSNLNKAEGTLCHSSSGRSLIVVQNDILGRGFLDPAADLVFFLPKLVERRDGMVVPETSSFAHASETCVSRGGHLPTPTQASQIDSGILSTVTYLTSEIWTNEATVVLLPEGTRGRRVRGAHTWIWHSAFRSPFSGALFGRSNEEELGFVCVR